MYAYLQYLLASLQPVNEFQEKSHSMSIGFKAIHFHTRTQNLSDISYVFVIAKPGLFILS